MTTYTITGQNTNYVEEIPAFDADATPDQINSYVNMADNVDWNPDGTQTLHFEIDGEADETYIITRNI